MFTYTIIDIVIVGALFFLAGMVQGYQQGRNEERKRSQETILKVNRQCPHGYEDWDKCPDCCH